jgi:hypothetical protein
MGFLIKPLHNKSTLLSIFNRKRSFYSWQQKCFVFNANSKRWDTILSRKNRGKSFWGEEINTSNTPHL